MFEAFHKKTNRGMWARQVWDVFEDPHKEDWVCCPIDNKKVEIVISHYRTINGEKIKFPSFFRIEGSAGNCINSGESERHKKLKMLTASLIENKEIQLCFNEIVLPYSSFDIKLVPDLPFRWEQKRGNRRADNLFEFKKFNSLFGQGLVFEIQTSEITDEAKEERTNDWIKSGYSIAWIDEGLFDSEGIKTNKIKIDYPYAVGIINILTNEKKSLWKLYEKSAQLRLEIEEYFNKTCRTCRTCKFGSLNKRVSGTIACWYFYRKKISKRPDVCEPLDSCENYEKNTGMNENTKEEILNGLV